MLGRLREELEYAAGFFEHLPMILCTEYVEPRLAEALRFAGIQFIDKAGNAFLDVDDVFLIIQGQPKPSSVRKKERAGRAFQGAGLKVLFELLRFPEMVLMPYRDIADATHVSVTTVKHCLDDLVDKGHLQKHDKHRRLHCTKRLLDEWSIAYRDHLRPELMVGRYRAETNGWWQQLDLAAHQACWSGEVAAEKLALMRHAQVQTIYRSGSVAELIARGRLCRDEDGTVEILEAFWQDGDDELAPDLLIYADLITSGSERAIETAQELYEQRIKRRFA